MMTTAHWATEAQFQQSIVELAELYGWRTNRGEEQRLGVDHPPGGDAA